MTASPRDRAAGVLGIGKLRALEAAGLEVVDALATKRTRDAAEVATDGHIEARRSLLALAAAVEREVGGERWRVGVNRALADAWAVLGPQAQVEALNRLGPRRLDQAGETRGQQRLDERNEAGVELEACNGIDSLDELNARR